MSYAVLVLLILVSATGCTTLPAGEMPATEQLLTAAGFQTQVADTPEQIAELQSLPARHLVRRSQNGAVSYVFADPLGCHCLYVGGDGEYRKYQRLRLRDEDSMNCWGWPWCTGYGG